jgi:hypothetical protein
VLIIGADFAPSSLPPATRIRFFAKHLPKFGWQPTILTTRAEYYESSVDAENEKLIPESLEVIRTRALPASLMRRVGISDIGMRSLWHHWRAVARLCKEKKIDLIFIPVPPPLQMILGRLAHMRFGMPYVVDYIDPWISEYYWGLPRQQRPPKWALAYAMSRSLEPFALKRVNHITGVSRGTTDQVVNRYDWLSPDQATEIPYGAEAGDFDYLRHNPRLNKIFDSRDGNLHVSYVGAYTEPMKQTLCAFFAAFRTAFERTPRLFERVLLHFVGTTYSTNGADPYRVTRVARECGVEAWVREHPQRVSYLDSLQITLDSHALILLGSNEPHYTASKVFPCVLAQRPLLAVFHEDSSVVKILRDTNTGRVVSFNSDTGPAEYIDDISKNLEELLCDRYRWETCWEAFEPYTTRAMAGRLAQVFNLAVTERG